jgi:ribonucleoside-diphosphate reductase alpha chain
MDYIFRRLALDHLSYEQRAELGILTTEERTAQLNGEDAGSGSDELDPEELAQSAAVERVRRSQPEAIESAAARPAPPTSAAVSTTELIESQQGQVADAPLCLTCGTKMRPAGSCYVCEGCGSTSGCS